ncbi:MAG: tRNA adenosine(34) deaminase TadA [Deltaproteobacteria bacterium]|nr:tRNA adenosine(34) deaminase TadA [Deltaproteobacteria bacterium]
MREKSLESPEKFMKSALSLARRAEAKGEVPIGALVVTEGKIVGRGYNLRETRHRPTAHAELLAIESAARKLGRWRLENSVLYVTLEPCLMCWGAIVLARIPKVIFGAKDPKAGVCGSILSLHEEHRFNHHPKVSGGLMDAACGKILSDFFKRLRKEKKQGKK